MIGTKVYHFEELASTNEYASLLLSKKSPINGTVITTDHQTHGKGQYGRKWKANPKENITLSVILYPSINAEDQFWLNMYASIAIADMTQNLCGAATKVKWPNDVYHNEAKLSGILIQNFLTGAKISSTIIGMGININQKEWPPMNKNATSLARISGREFDLAECQNALYQSLNELYPSLVSKDTALKRRYVQMMYGYQEIMTFEINEELKVGVIQGIDEIGRLVVTIDGTNHAYSMGEIRIKLK